MIRQPERPDADRYSIRAVDRAVDVLMAFTGRRREYTLSELAAAVNLEKPTVHRLVRTLERRRLIDRAPNGRYVLGSALSTLGMIVVESWSLPELLAPTLRKLVDETGETSLCSVLDGANVLTLGSHSGQHRLRMTAVAGELAPAAITADGKVLLADLDREAALRRIAVRTPEDPGTSRKWLQGWLEELAQVRREGFAVDRGGYLRGLYVVAGPVRDPRGVTCAAIAVAAPASRMDDEQLQKVTETLVRIAPATIPSHPGQDPPFVS
jgi:DNA-binding IclR family transcriptional regulator